MQARRLIAGGETRQSVAINYGVGVSMLYRIFPVGSG
ncbi:TPA: helix-turn-helix domain-containing protein [Enterobacter roggenkampii]|nr:helix-turn-helix domain-containing protein [Enterobacter roggenkampii]